VDIPAISKDCSNSPTEPAVPILAFSLPLSKPFGLNAVGLQRRGFSPEARLLLKRAYKTIYREGLTSEQAIVKLQPMVAECQEIQLLIDSLKNATHGVVR